MAKDRDKTFLQTDPHIGRIARARVAIIFNATWIARLFRRFAWDESHQDRHERRDHGRDSKQPAPLVFSDDPGPNGKSGENCRREVVNRHLPKLNHETEDAREGAALAAIEPRRVDLDHAG